ncbi:hypothetical protein PS925_03012 [Pseudomonas fluorescens]|jgi:hypothetical protein|uniref:Lipoprotein n=4 Tax=Pseudomonas TaxID=286 RepID=A0A5E6XC31_PSEFL|nr:MULTISPECIES: hypothetical protein [Pseudomonas]KHA73179.1 lipoprotein [Pseudomonas chlororaphis]PYC17487.1 hypothetical protein DMX02_20570 [Pseudomonas jessenii]AZZ78403.1 hypothetical protein CCX46_25780 [Pseudomonas sp. RU47]MCL9802859.1 hypothetical protein [Pseudomonas sp. AKS31]MDD1001117.1 hypothetical protein [Pseudomonas sp. TNT2022 ID642]
MWRCAGLLGVVLLLGGCQTTHEDLIAKGYPPAFADGFDDGCISGRQAAGSISGEFRKNVPRYLKDKQYAEGWTDGFRQCQAMLENKDREQYRNEHWDERERAWQQQKDQDAGRAYRSQ